MEIRELAVRESTQVEAQNFELLETVENLIDQLIKVNISDLELLQWFSVEIQEIHHVVLTNTFNLRWLSEDKLFQFERSVRKLSCSKKVHDRLPWSESQLLK